MEEIVANSSSSSPSWAQLLGSDHWRGLLDPLDLSLRELVLRCGDFCQVTYDSFVSDVHSKYCGACRYGRRSLLEKTSFPFAADYSVSEFLYATSEVDLPASFLLFSLSREAWSKESNWLGFVAVSTDAAARAAGRREIYVAWRGTIRDLEWVNVLRPELVPIHSDSDNDNDDDDDDDDHKPKVMKGWHTIYTSSDSKSPFTKTSARDQLLARIKQLVELHKHESLSVVCVGHSLGASLAVLSAYDIVDSGLSKTSGADQHFPVCAVVFGSPQVGNRAFAERLGGLPGLRVLHVKNKIDLIPLYPSPLLGYADMGTELVVDARKSPHLKDSRTPGDWHNLQGMLHSVAGWNGERGGFELRVRRSLAIVNKSCDYLKDECMVPGSWWVEKNRGMVLGPDGEWEMAPPDEDDLPVPSYVITGTGADPTAAGAAGTDEPPAPAPLRRFCTII
ncbi:phospholipase A1-II 5-like [Iris pallida]|uniref:Phospholipase A1 n=1 Tax=Iris pallida TaxID=29817 RepID=A0AAX6EG38_IRIPA|nr:phospholipase A1-II 5-like [Iris pallida]